MRPHYVWRVGDALSQLVNTMILGGDANESISGRSARIAYIEAQRDWPWAIAYRAINGIFFWQENHCLEAFTNDLQRAVRLVRDHGDLIHKSATEV